MEPYLSAIGTGVIANVVTALLGFGVSKIDKTQKIAQFFKTIKILPLQNNFESIYVHALIEYGIDKKPRELVKLFNLKEVQKDFEISLYNVEQTDSDLEKGLKYLKDYKKELKNQSTTRTKF